jgi:hypothetical protein
MAVTSPDYHREGEDAADRYKQEMDAYMRAAFGQMVDGLEDENVIHHWSATGREVEFRNTGLIGGTWCGSRHDEDQLWTRRPIPELARYRTPIEGLYHAHQTSGHPGGLCLMAIPYNLMHILIEDGIAEPGDWWYASPYYIPRRQDLRRRPDAPRERRCQLQVPVEFNYDASNPSGMQEFPRRAASSSSAPGRTG